MGRLADWCATQPAWAVDAMQRVATSANLTTENVDALVSRIASAHGLAVPGDHPCLPFSEVSVVSTEQVPDNVMLHSIGPLEGLDRLASDQTLKFALDGITIVFGDNASGKSGYTRALRQLCSARIDAPLQGDVFADGADTAKAITFSYQQGNESPVTETWTETKNKPFALRGITLLDTDNLRIYVEGKNEILYVPPEVACVGRLAELYQAASHRYRASIDASAMRCSSPFGGHYQQSTAVAALIARLNVSTAEIHLPTELQLRAAAKWSTDEEAELTRLGLQTANGPAAVAACSDRIAAACNTVVGDLERSVPRLSDFVIDLDGLAVATKLEKRRIAESLAAEQIGTQPLAATGSGTWQSLFRWARQFAAEAGLRQSNEPFVTGDPCPLCQQSLDEDAALRLAAFDSYIEGKAAQDANEADSAVSRRIVALRELTFKSEVELKALLGEAAAQSFDAEALVQNTIAFSHALKARRDERVRQLEAEQVGDLSPLPPSPIQGLRTWATSLLAHAATLRSGDAHTAIATARIAELAGQKQLHGQIEEVVLRRNELVCIHAWKACEAALNTGPLSRLMTSLRKELTSPGLQKRIEIEIENLALTHIPLKFADDSTKGTSFFEVALATEKKAKKERVLSEGEQRALSLACFLAETHVAGRRSGIILDDPVTSLDHARVRRVARRLVDEAAKGRQIIIFTHNLVFYHELMLACLDRVAPVPALPCLIQQGGSGKFGMVTVGSEPWVARKVKDRELTLKALIDAIPDDAPLTSEEYGRRCTSFYAALRETWERAVEEVLLNDVVRRFGSDVGTLRLGGVDVSDDDFAIVHRAMKRASEHSGHDQAAGRQIDVPTKDQLRADLYELQAFRATKSKSNKVAEQRRKANVERPPTATIG